MPIIDLGSVVGPQGPQGATGARGAQGIQGVAGPNQVTANTSTTLTGVLQGNGSKVSALAVDTAPASGSTHLVTSGGIYTAIANADTRSAVIFNSSGGESLVANAEITLSASYQNAKFMVMWLMIGGYSAGVIVPGYTLTIPASVPYSVRSGSGGGVADTGCMVWGVVNNSDSTRDYTKLKLVGIYNSSGAVTNAYLRQIQAIF